MWEKGGGADVPPQAGAWRGLGAGRARLQSRFRSRSRPPRHPALSIPPQHRCDRSSTQLLSINLLHQSAWLLLWLCTVAGCRAACHGACHVVLARLRARTGVVATRCERLQHAGVRGRRHRSDPAVTRQRAIGEPRRSDRLRDGARHPSRRRRHAARGRGAGLSARPRTGSAIDYSSVPTIHIAKYCAPPP